MSLKALHHTAVALAHCWWRADTAAVAVGGLQGKYFWMLLGGGNPAGANDPTVRAVLSPPRALKAPPKPPNPADLSFSPRLCTTLLSCPPGQLTLPGTRPQQLHPVLHLGMTGSIAVKGARAAAAAAST